MSIVSLEPNISDSIGSFMQEHKKSHQRLPNWLPFDGVWVNTLGLYQLSPISCARGETWTPMPLRALPKTNKFYGTIPLFRRLVTNAVTNFLVDYYFILYKNLNGHCQQFVFTIVFFRKQHAQPFRSASSMYDGVERRVFNRCGVDFLNWL